MMDRNMFSSCLRLLYILPILLPRSPAEKAFSSPAGTERTRIMKAAWSGMATLVHIRARISCFMAVTRNEAPVTSSSTTRITDSRRRSPDPVTSEVSLFVIVGVTIPSSIILIVAAISIRNSMPGTDARIYAQISFAPILRMGRGR